MTVKVDLGEFLGAFIAEVDEQLAGATSKLLVIDAAARKGERQPRAIRDLLRAMHTVKGLAAMVGVEPIVTITHRMETVVREADRGGGQLAIETVDLLLRGVREIERAVRIVEKGSAAPEPPAALLDGLDAVAPQEAKAPDGRAARLLLDPALDEKLDAFERDLLLKGAAEGRRAVRLDYVPTPARSAQGLNINTVRERLAALAEIVRVVPMSLAPTAGAPPSVAFALLLLTKRSDEEIAAAAGMGATAVQPIVGLDSPPSPALPPLSSPGEDLLPDVDLRPDEAPHRSLLRVDAARVDDAMDRLGLLIVTRSRLARAIAKLAASGSDTGDLVQIANENARQLKDLRAAILQVRMVPITEILERLPLMLRALTRSSGRQVRLDVQAAGAELDKIVAERVFPAIVHLIRNAVDHGIESPEARVAAGKPVEGVVRITCAARSSTRLEMTVEDDGRGVDAAAVAARAHVTVPDSASGLLELLCQPGFSTRNEATTTSGRGLGMDIVKRIVVDQLGGELSMYTVVGAGTRFTLQVPLTVAIVDAFVVECAGQRFAVPVSVVEEILEVAPDRIIAPPRTARGAVTPVGMIERRGEVLPLYALRSLLGFDGEAAAGSRAMVVRRAGETIGFLLDRVVGQQEAVIRPLLDPLVRVPGVSASTDLGDGRPTLVLDFAALVSRGRALSAGSPDAATRGLFEEPDAVPRLGARS